ncbi:hypothetical protein X946_4788 [Burkholderia sp. ABCPW 111]|nr:hypothetical protein X946_4788 [Burkholderia sp. ABCPW 111]
MRGRSSILTMIARRRLEGVAKDIFFMKYQCNFLLNFHWIFKEFMYALNNDIS